MANQASDAVPGSVAMPASGETVAGQRFTVTKGTSAITFCMPALAGTAATCKLQVLYTPADDQAAEVWADVSCFDPATGTLVALDGILESVATTIPTTLTGGGVLRLVASETQAAAPSTIKLIFHKAG